MNLTAVIVLVGGLLDWINKTMEDRRRAKELTAEEEAAYDKHIGDKMKEPHWKPDEPS